MSDRALCDHGFDGSVQSGFEHATEVHFEACGVDYYLAVEEDLVRFAEGECELIFFHEFAVLFAAFAFHFGEGAEARGSSEWDVVGRRKAKSSSVDDAVVVLELSDNFFG